MNDYNTKSKCYKLKDKINSITLNEDITELTKNYTKKQVDNIFINLWKIEEFENVKDFDWFIEHRNKLIHILNSLFDHELVWETDDFIDFFNKWMSWKLDENIYTKEKINKFNNLLLNKNLLLKKITLITLENWIYDEFLSENEVCDYINILKSGIFDLFDKIYFKIKDSIDLFKNQFIDENWNNTYTWKLSYWWLTKDWIVGFNYFADKSDLEKFWQFDFSIIKQEALRKYLIKFQELFISWITNYDEWIKLADFEMDTWNDINSNIWIVWSMEEYWLTWILIDPELEFFIKKPTLEYANKASDLSLTYFNDSYNMEDTKYSNVEPLMSAWVVSFKRVLWKNFHNDKKIQDKYWMYWYSIESRLKWNSSVLKDSEKVLWKLQYLTSEKSWKHDVIHTWQHEFWHNLFKSDNTAKSLLEENKANLFFYLFKYENIKTLELSDEEIILDIEFIITENIRRFKNLGDDSLFEYILSAKLQLQKLFDNNLISWNKDWLISIKPDEINMKKYLEDMKDFLYITKDIYKNNDKNKENMIINEINSSFEENLLKIKQLLSK